MSPTGKYDRHHRPPGFVRHVLGWLTIGLGLALMVLPGPGLLVLALGLMLLGPRHPGIRRSALLIRLALRRMSRAEHRVVRHTGISMRVRHARARAFIQEQLRRHAQGQPLAPAVRLWIVFTVLTALASAGMGLLILFS